MHTYVSADGHVHLLVAPSEVAAERLEPVAAERLVRDSDAADACSISAVAGHLPRPRVLRSSLPLGQYHGHQVEGLQVEAGCARRCVCAGVWSKASYGPKDHLPRAGRRTYVRLSSQKEGRGPWWTTGNSWQRGVFKWFKHKRAEVTDSPTDSDDYTIRTRTRMRYD
jgi:hypothetical protein